MLLICFVYRFDWCLFFCLFLMWKKNIKNDKKTPKIRIKLKSYDVRMLESSLWKVMWTLEKSRASIAWPIPLPKKRKLYTVIKANFVYKSSREQFERWTYTRLIDIGETWP